MLYGDIWINITATSREIVIKGKWRLTNFEEELDFEYSYFKEFDKSLGLPPVDKPVFAIEKDYSMLIRSEIKTPPFSKSELELKNVANIFGGVYRGWFSYNDQTLNEFSSLNFLPGETPETFSIEGDGHNSIGVYIVDGTATFDLNISAEEGEEMVKIGEMKFYKYYSSLKDATDPLAEKNDEPNTNRISLKINTRPVFEVVNLAPEQAAEVRKTFPELK